MENIKELNEKEILEINGGESGWYYLSYAIGSVDQWLGDLFFEEGDYFDTSWEQFKARNY